MHFRVTFFVLLGVGLAASSSADDKNPSKDNSPKLHRSDKYALHFYYPGKESIEAYFHATPCISGVIWEYTSETKTHWIGELHGVSENTRSKRTGFNNRPPVLFMLAPVSIRKQVGMPVDLKTYKGPLVLRKLDPTVTLGLLGGAEDAENSTYDFVGYQPSLPENAPKQNPKPFFPQHLHLMWKPKANGSKESK